MTDDKPKTLRQMWREEASLPEVFDRIDAMFKEIVAARPPTTEQKTMLDQLAQILTKLYGPRCAEREAGCMKCFAWTVYDTVEALTDSSFLDERSAGLPSATPTG